MLDVFSKNIAFRYAILSVKNGNVHSDEKTIFVTRAISAWSLHHNRTNNVLMLMSLPLVIQPEIYGCKFWELYRFLLLRFKAKKVVNYFPWNERLITNSKTSTSCIAGDWRRFLLN